MKLLLLFVLFSTPLCAEENYISITPTPINGFTIPQKLNFFTITSFYKMAIQEYKDANYGFSKELFEATVKRTDAFPKAYFYLGNIYGNIEPFKNSKISKEYYRLCIEHPKSSKELKQIAYIYLNWYTQPSLKERQEYIEATKKLGDTHYSRMLELNQIWNKDPQVLTKLTEKVLKEKEPIDKEVFQRANYLIGE